MDISFTDGSAGIQGITRRERRRIGKIDPDCVSKTNESPRLTRQQATARAWTPDAATRRPSPSPDLTIRNWSMPFRLDARQSEPPRDPVGAPIFYRDVPLMPAETEKGVIEPLARFAVRLVSWKIRDIGAARSQVVMGNVPVCANCHSFSSNGRTLGMDMDGLQRNHAETRNFTDAVLTARKALESAKQANNEAVMDALQSRIALYEAGKPFRATPVH
jgi:hypothetical protein